ncbi:hypothetical protein Pan181_03120 [Aeoliella mucimassa]|uniref:Uncharacterized protein n=1 Tax=Aeoliella mucimassa TaxID=2527972 RepID=A0A518AHE5_9BACT|nr:hypothetical protein Pan181_03120 [Aeoliella mucimassa]
MDGTWVSSAKRPNVDLLVVSLEDGTVVRQGPFRHPIQRCHVYVYFFAAGDVGQ